MKCNRILSENDLIIGDVLLCSANDYVGRLIKDNTKSNYVHAAIYLGDGMVAEAMVKGNKSGLSSVSLGAVVKENISNVIARYEYLAVLRPHPSLGWQFAGRRKLLLEFVDILLENKVGYNFYGALMLARNGNKQFRGDEKNNKLYEFLNGKRKVPSPIKKKYFCSELIVDCFRYGGILDKSTYFHIVAEDHSPGDLAKSNNFGWLLGYLSSSKGFKVPKSDDLFFESTYDEIMNA